MSSPSVEVLGAPELARTLSAAADRIGQLEGIQADAARQLTQASQREAPRVSGRLAGSIHATRTGNEIAVGTGLIYGPPIHNGWRGHNISPNPFLKRGLADAEPYIVDAYARGVSEAISHVRGA